MIMGALIRYLESRAWTALFGLPSHFERMKLELFETDTLKIANKFFVNQYRA